MTPAELLRAGRERIARGHARDAYARDDQGREVYAWSPEACAWCALGALRFGPDFGGPVYGAAVDALLRAGDGLDFVLATFNDTHPQADVLALFDRAIAAADGGAP